MYYILQFIQMIMLKNFEITCIDDCFTTLLEVIWIIKSYRYKQCKIIIGLYVLGKLGGFGLDSLALVRLS